MTLYLAILTERRSSAAASVSLPPSSPPVHAETLRRLPVKTRRTSSWRRGWPSRCTPNAASERSQCCTHTQPTLNTWHQVETNWTFEASYKCKKQEYQYLNQPIRFQWAGLTSTIPVHVCQSCQHVRRLAKASVLLVVSPQEVHVTHFTLVLFDHVHQMILEVRRIHLDQRRNGP